MLAYIAKRAFDGKILKHPGPQIFGTYVGKTDKGESVPLLHFLYCIDPAGPKEKDVLRIHVLLVEVEAGIVRDILRQHFSSFLNKEWPLPPFALFASAEKYSSELREFVAFLARASTRNRWEDFLNANRDRWHEINAINPDLQEGGIKQTVIVRTFEFAVWQALMQLGEDGIQHPDRRVAEVSLPVPGWTFSFSYCH
ncbi:MAG TPA: hypothetical protein VGX03_21840 [Candidatus Binatia bacterium]|jgi:hypothetical protein|nr:hypothetical protein [Candidatus Binatia bacterium]